jgi:general secretion pathway protein A
MASAAPEHSLELRRAAYMDWQGAEDFPLIRFSPEIIESLAELVMSGYQRYSWGGVEVGGILFGKRETDIIHVHSFLSIDCEHEYGPSFELSKKDLDAVDRMLASAGSDEELKGLLSVGWYHSTSRPELSLAKCDRALHERLFSHAWQFAMVLQRSQTDPLAIGLFCSDAHGSLAPHSPQREFTIENFRLRGTEIPVAAAAPTSPPIEIAPKLPLAPVSKSEIKISKLELLPPAPPAPENRYGFLGLREDPFSSAPDPRYFYPAPQHKEALANLIYGIQSRQGFIAMMGAAGTGKSLVLEHLTEHLKANSTEFAFLFNSKINPEQFFELLAHDLDLKCEHKTKTSILIALNEYLVKRSQAGQSTVLIVDNAQKLGTEVLEEIELLGNLENRRGHLLQVIFAAQPSFERQLETPELRGLRQRLVLRSRVTPLHAEQVSEYVECRLAKAGLADQNIFPPYLLLEIHTRTRGIPRLINAVCASLLTHCLGTQVSHVDLRMLDGVSAELDLDRWNGDEHDS